MSIKVYCNGSDFLNDYLAHILHEVDTNIFLVRNAPLHHSVKDGRIVVASSDWGEYLFAQQDNIHNIVLVGSVGLVPELLSSGLFQEGIPGIVGERNLVLRFMQEYTGLYDGKFTVINFLNLMQLTTSIQEVDLDVCQVTDEYFDDYCELTRIFLEDALHKNPSDSEVHEVALKYKDDAYILPRYRKAVAKAQITARHDRRACISGVATLRGERGHGYARAVVSYICKQLQAEGYAPYLFADGNNNISNSLYYSMGFDYVSQLLECKWKK